MFASLVQEQFRVKARRIDRSVKQAGFLVLRQTAMPGILIEAGFINHPSEREYLMSNSGRERLASSIFDAFSNYKSKIEARSSFNLTTEVFPQLNNESTVQNMQQNNPVNNYKTDIFFSVQIASLSSPVETSSRNFKGENSVFMIESKKSYKYYCGEFKTVNEAQKEQKRLRTKFKGAFVVAFENNMQIPIEDALKKL
jgi:N-acetylmuramoyl-L-alanine amidase